MLFPFRHGYPRLGELLDAMPPGEWRRDEAVLGALVLHLLKLGQAARAKSYMNAKGLEFERSYRFEIIDLLLALHLGEPVSEAKLASWRRLERALPVSEPLLLGLYYNAMMAMFVRLGRLEEAAVAGQQAISCYREDGNVYLEHFIHIHLADLDVMEGRLRRALRRLSAAERCLEQSGVRYGNETEVIEVIRLAIAYEHGQFDRVRMQAPQLRNSLLNGDSWSELFFQLARIGVLSTFFVAGRSAAQRELDLYQADYARRHSGAPHTIDALNALIWHLEWHPNEAEQIVDTLKETPMHSAIGSTLVRELECAMGRVDATTAPSPRAAIVSALNCAQGSRGQTRHAAIEAAIRLALEEGHIAPFLENRDVFLGVSSKLANGRFARGHRSLSRLTKLILRQVERSYVVPDKLSALGFNRRQYRVAAALQSGASNKQIARQLGSSEASVKYHLTSLYRMTQTKRRTQLVDFIDDLRVF